jgi:predicted Zn-dependent peptidase
LIEYNKTQLHDFLTSKGKMAFLASKLQNGLTILTYRMPNVNSIAMNLIAKVGSRCEDSAEVGMSHFLEHMAFKGTKTRSARKIAEEFDSIGGQFNAYTGYEQTIYYAKVLNDNFEKGLEILADIIQNSVFSAVDIEKEYKVILQEIAQVQDNPDDLVYEEFTKLAYKDQPLGRSILGDQNTLSKFNSDSFAKYLNKYYNAENIYLSIAGNVDHDHVVATASNLFTSLQNKDNEIFVPAEYVGGYNFITKDLEQTTLALGFESIPYTKVEQFYHAQILSLIFGGGVSSRLFQHIREDLGLAYSVGSYNSAYYDSGLFSIHASTSHNNVDLLMKGLLNEIKKVTDHISDSELDRAKAQIKASIYMAEERSSYKSEIVGRNFTNFSKYISVEEVIEYIMNTNKSDILNVGHKIFSAKPTLSIVGVDRKTIDYQQLCKKLAS